MSAQAYGTPQRILGEFIYRGGFTLATLPKDDMAVRIEYDFVGGSDYQSHGGSVNFCRQL